MSPILKKITKLIKLIAVVGVGSSFLLFFSDKSDWTNSNKTNWIDSGLTHNPASLLEVRTAQADDGDGDGDGGDGGDGGGGDSC